MDARIRDLQRRAALGDHEAVRALCAANLRSAVETSLEQAEALYLSSPTLLEFRALLADKREERGLCQTCGEVGPALEPKSGTWHRGHLDQLPCTCGRLNCWWTVRDWESTKAPGIHSGRYYRLNPDKAAEAKAHLVQRLAERVARATLQRFIIQQEDHT